MTRLMAALLAFGSFPISFEITTTVLHLTAR